MLMVKVPQNTVKNFTLAEFRGGELQTPSKLKCGVPI